MPTVIDPRILRIRRIATRFWEILGECFLLSLLLVVSVAILNLLRESFPAPLLWRVVGVAMFVGCVLVLLQDTAISRLFLMRNLGLFLFAAGCIYYGAFAYAGIAFPVWALLIGSLIISRRIADSSGTLSAALRNALAPFSVGFTAVLALLLLFTILTPANAAVRFFEARFAVWYQPLDNVLDPGFKIMLPVWVAILFLRQRFKRIRWLAMYKKVTGYTSQVAKILACVATFLFTAGHVVSDHARDYGMQVNREFHKEATRLARARREQSLGRQMIESLQNGNPKLRQDFLVFAKSAVENGHQEGSARWVADEIGAASKRLLTEGIPEALRQPATSQSVLEKQHTVLAEEKEEADEAENAAALFAVDAASMLAPGDGLLAGFLKAVLGNLADSGLTEINPSSLEKVHWERTIDRISARDSAESSARRGADLIEERLRRITSPDLEGESR